MMHNKIDNDEHTPLVSITEGASYNALPPEEQGHVSFDNQVDDDYGASPVFHRINRHSRGDSLLEDISHAIFEKVEQVNDTISESISEVKEVLDEPILPFKPREEGDHSQKLSALALAVIVFYKVSGGPFGCEPAVRAAGPFYALLGFSLFPILWCIPEALVTAELGSAYPEPSGAVAWVEEAFGPRASLLCGYFHWVSGATDNAIYPTLFLHYIAPFIGNFLIDNIWLRFLFASTMSVVLSAINYLGLEIVGNLSIVVSIVSMSPFVILCLCAIPSLEPSRWMIMPERGITLDDDYHGAGFVAAPLFAGVLWRPLLNNLFWNLNSFDAGASFAGEVRDPETVFPRAIFLSVVFVVLSYLLPLLAALGGMDSDQDDWSAGYFTTAVTTIAGPWLGAWMVFAAAISNIALYQAEMSGDAYQLMGMADRGLIPKLFTKRSRFGTPENGIILNTLVIILMSVADFEQLVEMLNFAYSFSYLMEFSAFVKLRITDDDVDRPYRIPLNTFGCILFVLPPSIFLIYLVLIASKLTFVYFLGLSVFGLGFHVVQKVFKHYHLVEYQEAPKRTKKKRAGSPSAPV